jgi:hypothetical protein
MSRFDHGPDVTVLQNQASPFTCSPDDDIHHRPGQVVRSNHLVGKQHPKRGVDPAQQAISEIRFVPRLYGIDVRRPEEINASVPMQNSLCKRSNQG